MASRAFHRFALYAICLATGVSQSMAAELPKPIGDYFSPWSACALIKRHDRHRSLNIEFNAEQCRMPLSPCSTFKIPNALIGLQTGVVSGPDHLKPWDGRESRFKARNRDHTLASAIRYSVVWYFQDLARDVGEQRMQDWLDRLDYGNRDASAGIDQFWLGSSLEITAYEQLAFLRELTHSNLPFAPENQATVQDMLRLESDLDGQLHGKTGSCLGGDDDERPDHGWFIGWVEDGTERNPRTTLFVFNIRGEDAWGWKTREIALQLLGDLQD